MEYKRVFLYFGIILNSVFTMPFSGVKGPFADYMWWALLYTLIRPCPRTHPRANVGRYWIRFDMNSLDGSCMEMAWTGQSWYLIHIQYSPFCYQMITSKWMVLKFCTQFYENVIVKYITKYKSVYLIFGLCDVNISQWFKADVQSTYQTKYSILYVQIEYQNLVKCTTNKKKLS